MREMQVQPPGREDPLEKEMATLSSTLVGKSHGQRSLASYSPWGHKESNKTWGSNKNNNVATDRKEFVTPVFVTWEAPPPGAFPHNSR